MRLSLSVTLHRMLALSLACLVPSLAHAGPVTARRKQEQMHRSVLLKDASGMLLANGEEVASLQGDLVHARLTFHFLDGSLDDEETVFTQDGTFHLISDHHVQKGPSFPSTVDLAVDVPSGKVTWHQERLGKDATLSQTMQMPDDLANGIMLLLVENYPPDAAQMRVSWVAIAFRPIFATVSVSPKGTADVDPDGVLERANEYVIHAELHGVIGMFAPLANKMAPDIHIWTTDEKAPAFVKLSGAFYAGGPVWTVQPAGPATLQ